MANPRKPMDAEVALAGMRRSAELMGGKIKPQPGRSSCRRASRT
jgi:hypothetical protein